MSNVSISSDLITCIQTEILEEYPTSSGIFKNVDEFVEFAVRTALLELL